MGDVWEGTDDRLSGRACAVKQVLLGGSNVVEQAERKSWFAREASTLASLKHPNICDIRDVFEEDGNGYLVLELVEGHTLAQELATRGSPGLPLAQVLDWTRHLGDAQSYLHGHVPPIIFRDMKPQNVMLRPSGQVVLIDFGIARSAIAAGGTTIGTPGYAPPEQYQGLAKPQSDQYSLAATMHHLLTGRNPEQQPPFMFPPVRDFVARINPAVDTALARALAMRVDDRFPTVNDFLAALSPEPGHTGSTRIGTQAARTIPPTKSPNSTVLATSFGEGMWRVGIDIAPGTYRTPGDKHTSVCYVLRHSFKMEDQSVLAYTDSGPCIVTIGPDAIGVRFHGGGVWTKID